MKPPPYIAAHLDELGEDAWDEYVEREAIIAADGLGHSHRLAYVRVCGNNDVRPRDEQLSQLTLPVGRA